MLATLAALTNDPATFGGVVIFGAILAAALFASATSRFL